MSVENGSSGDVTKIKFKDENTGWYIADIRLLYKTTNGGLNWKGIDFKNVDSVKELGNFINVGDILLISINFPFQDKRILKSTNGGENWFALIPNINWRLGNFQLINVNVLYADATYNQSSFLVKSTDLGNTWDSIPGNYPGQSYSKYSFVNESIGYVLSGSRIFNTSDGGRKWNLIYSDSNQFDNIYFINQLNGFLVKNIAYLFRTSDGGISWDSIGNYRPEDFIFEDSITGYMIKGSFPNAFYKTTDGGRSWVEKYNYPIPVPFVFREFKDLEKINNTFYIAARYGGGIFKSTNNGENWSNISLYSWNFSFNSLDFFNANTGFIGGWRTGIRQTTNSGINWFENEGFKSVANIYRRNIYKIQFVNETTGWALTDTGFYKTTNSGVNWNYHNPVINPSISYKNFQFVNKDLGYLIGFDGTYSRVFKTIDGGEVFFSQYTILNQIMDDIKFYDSLYGYVSIGNILGGPNLIRTTNGGTSWQGYNLGNILGYYKIDIIDRNIAYVAERGVFKTTNGGDTWTDLQNLYLSATGIKFINANSGFIISQGGNNFNLYITTNGGVNWRYSNIGSNYPLFGIYLNHQGLGFAYSNHNKIYRTDNFGGIVNITNSSLNIPDKYILHQNYPNPFNPKTIINYELPIASFVTIKVFNVLGEEVAILINERKNAGKFLTEFSSLRNNLSSGIYFYSLFINGNLLNTKKMILQK